MASRLREELLIQLVILGLSCLAMGLFVFIQLPRWKREMLMREAMDKILDQREAASHYLSGREEMLLAEFRRMVSDWDREQLLKFRKKTTNDRLSELQERKQRGETPRDSTA